VLVGTCDADRVLEALWPWGTARRSRRAERQFLRRAGKELENAERSAAERPQSHNPFRMPRFEVFGSNGVG
jgi:hypothetical protein